MVAGNWVRLALKACSLMLVACSVVAAADAPNTLTGKESKAGWILLFDGKALDGWVSRPTSVPGAKGDWSVQDGAILCGGSVPSWISTTRSFSDFKLSLEFRGNPKVNSGVFLRSAEEGQPHVTGYELQIWDYQPEGYLTGSLVGSAKAGPVKILPDKWNRYEVTAKADRFTVVLNGKTVLDTHDSKHQAGAIGFQCQQDQRIEFRNVKLQPLAFRQP